MIKVRLHGESVELAEMVAYFQMKQSAGELEIKNISQWYKDRKPSKYVRIYLDIELKKEVITSEMS